jgi:hypothetical protein
MDSSADQTATDTWRVSTTIYIAPRDVPDEEQALLKILRNEGYRVVNSQTVIPANSLGNAWGELADFTPWVVTLQRDGSVGLAVELDVHNALISRGDYSLAKSAADSVAGVYGDLRSGAKTVFSGGSPDSPISKGIGLAEGAMAAAVALGALYVVNKVL